MKRLVFFLPILLAGCMSQKQFNDYLRKALQDDPSILTSAIEANPLIFMESLQKAAKEAQSNLAKKRQQDEQKKLEERYSDPYVPLIRKDESFRGNKNAPITLIEYSDFECPFCSRAFNTVSDLLEKYKGKIRFAYKHLPLSFHPNAMIAAKYYEAIRLQSPKKAWEFHDGILRNQQKLKKGEPFLKGIAKKVGANMSKLAKDINSDKVKNRIDEDLKEAAKFGFQGTPGFLLNGVPVKGAYPVSHFDSIINELKKRGKLKLDS